MARGENEVLSVAAILDRYCDLPPARGQRYERRVGAFFDIADGAIVRVSNHYNLADWLCQVQSG